MAIEVRDDQKEDYAAFEKAWADTERKLSGQPGWTPEAIQSMKEDQWNRVMMNKGNMHNGSSYEYGGSRAAAQRSSATYGGIGDRSLDRQNQFFDQGWADRENAMQSRSGQNQVADIMLARARGELPSVAQQQADRQMGQLASEQASAAASARGPAALALAQQNAAANAATGQSAISGQAQINAAMERERAEQAAFGAYSGMRGQDQQGQGMSYGAATGAGAQALGYHGLQHNVNTTQLQAQGNKEGQRSADKWAQASQDERNRARQDQKEAGYLGAVSAGTMGGMQMINNSKGGGGDEDGMTSDERAKQPAALPTKPMGVTNGPAPNTQQGATASQGFNNRVNPANTSMGASRSLDPNQQFHKPVVGKSLLDGGEMRAGPNGGNPVAPKRPDWNPGRMNAGQSTAIPTGIQNDQAGNVPVAQVGGYGVPPLPMPGVQQQMLSDERAKQPATWSSSDAILDQSGAEVSAYQKSRDAAAKILDEQEARERAARSHEPVAGTPGGPASMYGGVEAIDRYEQDQVDTLKAKDRHGVALSRKEQRMKDAAQHGQKYGDQRGQTPPPPPVATGRPPEKPAPTDKATKEAKGGGWNKSQNQGFDKISSGVQSFFARPQMASGGGYIPPQQQQITSDMGAKRPADIVSDERLKVSADWSDSRSKSVREAERKDDDINGSWTKAMVDQSPLPTRGVGFMGHEDGSKRLGLPDFLSDMGTKQASPMLSDMGTKQASPVLSDMNAKQQAPMYSDDRTKLAAAWDQGHQAALSDVEKASKMSPDELKKRKGTPAVDVARNLKANAWDEGHGANARESAKLAQASVQRAAQKEPGFDIPGTAPTAGDKLLSNVSNAGNRAMDRVMDDEPRQMVPSTLSSRLRARAGAMARPSSEPASLPAGGTGVPGHREEEAEMYSDKRAKRMSDEDAAKLSSDADKAFSAYRDPETKAMAGAARAMEAAPYSYKEEFRPPEQAPGEVNVGPMAQNMAKDPVARTAVRQDPNSGLLSLDRDKMLKVLAGTSAAQQQQLDEANRQIAHLKKGADRPSYFDAKADKLKGEADREIQNLRSASERGPSVIDRERPQAPPSWLSKYMDDEEQKPRRGQRMGLADFMGKRRRA